ncbi:MAG TPA: SDR family oxidoreductase [Cytophagaceae bacterium]|jgi:3-oxoacyl-[acyl-carrier protein] reductase|nr:SDR family oxidoreductase [Cytophagaceae bacterium]
MRKAEHKIVIISGSADAITAAAIQKFCQNGARVFLWDTDEQKGKIVLAQLKAQKLTVDFLKTDITSLENTERRAKEIYEKYKRIDILINNAAGSYENNEADWQKMIDKSLHGVMNCIKAVSPYMLLNSFGRILNTTALLGLYGDINQANYTAVKNGVIGISKIWALELSKHNITVNTIAPGYIESEYITKNTLMVLKSIKEKIPARKIGTAKDIADAYFFLASEEASYITGTVLNVDGGYSV